MRNTNYAELHSVSSSVVFFDNIVFNAPVLSQSSISSATNRKTGLIETEGVEHIYIHTYIHTKLILKSESINFQLAKRKH